MLKSFAVVSIFVCVVKLVFASGNQNVGKCRENEVLSDCVNRVSEYRKCSELGKPIERVEVDSCDCRKGCVCKAKYLRGDNGTCIPTDQCSTACGKNQIYDTCIVPCPPRICNVDERVRCKSPPQPGDPECQAGCRCADNFYKNNEDVCVPKNECPLQCGDNEIPTSCFEAICERRSCSDLGKPVFCVRLDPSYCSNGCLCKEGYLRDENGICVPIDQCPKVCGDNEIPTTCFEAVCERRSCSDLGKPVSCVRLDPSYCTDGCLCKEGYVWDENGICVPINQCPNIQCGDKEILDICPSLCPGEGCNVDPSLILCLPNPQPGDPDCKPGCRCEDNYFRNDYGFCVTRDQCQKPPNVICGPNEVPTDCVNGGCGTWYCSQTEPICNLILDEDCIPGCFCRDGWLRAENETCIPADQCPLKCDGPNEFFTCGGACDNVCSTLSTQNQTNCNIVNKKCNPKCYCQEGYARDDNNICIPINQCPPLNCFSQNEVRGCQSSCPQTCESIGKKYNCPLETNECKQECRCKEGFYRNKIGECISKANCLKCINDPNSFFSCGGACDNVCATLSTQNQTNCPFVNIVCNPMCYCEEGYARDGNNTCIPISQCPKPICGKNEVLDECPATCPPRTCKALGRAYKCKAPPQPGDPECNPGCRCADNFYRNKQGVCVPKNKCPKPIVCGADEVYTDCVNGGCGRWNCSQPGPICINLIKGGCIEGCRCKEGLLRADNGTCIPADQCPNNNNTNTGLIEFEQGNIVFTLRFLYEATKINPGVSLIFSPFSVLFLLAQLALYAVGTTQEQLLRLLNLDTQQIRNFIPKYLDTLNSQQNVSFDLAEKVYGNIQYKFSRGFEKDTSEIFKAEAENVDFCKPSEAARDINAWVQQKTNNLIKDLVSPSTLSCNTVLVLLNAIYFKGDWKDKFNPDNTRKQNFYVNSKKTVQVDMMSRTGTYKYGEVQYLDAQVVEIPYKNEDFSLMIWLPKTKDGINNMINKLIDTNYSFNKVLTELTDTRLEFSMPVFNITTTTDLKQLLIKLNTTAIFDPKVSEFNGILQNPEKIYVTSGIQKATIIVNESGSEAAAGNALVVGVTSVQQSIKLIANHPFIFLIVYKGTPIFCGIYFANV